MRSLIPSVAMVATILAATVIAHASIVHTDYWVASPAIKVEQIDDWVDVPTPQPDPKVEQLTKQVGQLTEHAQLVHQQVELISTLLIAEHRASDKLKASP